MSICVLSLQRNNVVNVIDQFKKQHHANKTLIIFETTTPLVKPASIHNVMYINPMTDLNMEFEETNTKIITSSQSIKRILKEIGDETSKKNELDKVIIKLEKSVPVKKPSLPVGDKDDSEENFNNELKKKQNEICKTKASIVSIVNDITKREETKSVEEKNLESLKKVNELIVKKISTLRSEDLNVSDCKQLALSATNADFYTFMDSDLYYKPSYLSNMVGYLNRSNKGVVSQSNVYVYSKHLTLQVSNKTTIVLPITGFKRECLMTEAPPCDFIQLQSVLVKKKTNPPPHITNVYNKVDLLISHNKTKVLNMFNFR